MHSIHALNTCIPQAIRELLRVVVECDALTVDDEEGGSVDMTSIPGWVKLRELSVVLDLPMATIIKQWEDGHLANCHFTCDEVIHIVLQ
jgi:hypothetical protein